MNQARFESRAGDSARVLNVHAVQELTLVSTDLGAHRLPHSCFGSFEVCLARQLGDRHPELRFAT